MSANKSHLLINENSLQVLPSLAIALGLEEAIALQQLHYWLNNAKSEGRIDEEGNKWVYNTYAQWKEDNFPFWSEDKIQRVFLSLEKSGAVISAQLDAKNRDMRKFYRIDYDAVCAMDGLKSAPSKGAKVNDVNRNTETTTETTTEKPAADAALTQEEMDKALDGVEMFVKMSEPPQGFWAGRELLPEYMLPFGDWWNSQTHLTMRGKVNKEWLKTFKEWYEEQLSINSLQQAFDHIKAWKQIISKPSEITATARAIEAGQVIQPKGKNNISGLQAYMQEAGINGD